MPIRLIIEIDSVAEIVAQWATVKFGRPITALEVINHHEPLNHEWDGFEVTIPDEPAPIPTTGTP